jgi:hypothetical protein
MYVSSICLYEYCARSSLFANTPSSNVPSSKPDKNIPITHFLNFVLRVSHSAKLHKNWYAAVYCEIGYPERGLDMQCACPALQCCPTTPPCRTCALFLNHTICCHVQQPDLKPTFRTLGTSAPLKSFWVDSPVSVSVRVRVHVRVCVRVLYRYSKALKM